MPTLLAVLALLAAPEVYTGTLVHDLTLDDWVQVDTSEEAPAFIHVPAWAAVVWHLDGATPMPRSSLRAGVRIRWSGPRYVEASRVEVVLLGPLAMEAAVEEWVVEASGGRLAEGLSASELAIVEAMGSRSWLVRSAVSRALEEQGAKALKPLLWMRRSPDREVKARAEAVLSRLGWER